MFDQENVKRKLNALKVTVEEAEAGNNVTKLILDCNWDQLTMALVKHKILVTIIQRRKELIDQEYKALNNGIAAMRK